MEKKQMPGQIGAYHHRNMAQTRIPMWHFSGLLLLVVAMAFGVYASGQDKLEQAALIKSPVAGDVYELKTETGSYTTFKIVNVVSDTVEVRLNNYEVNKVTGIGQIDKDENYSDSTYTLPVGTLSEMFAAGEILDVNRH